MTFAEVSMLIDGVEVPSMRDTADYASAMKYALEKTREHRSRVGGGFVLVDLDIDESGRVTAATPAEPPAIVGGVAVVAVSKNAATGERMPPLPPHTTDTVLRAAAIEVLRTAAFSPAKRDGVPVAYRGFRFGIAFDSEPRIDEGGRSLV